MNKLNKVIVKFENPNYNYSTSVSSKTNSVSAKQYFVNKFFNIGAYPIENLQKCTSIEFIENTPVMGSFDKNGDLI